MPTRPSRKQAVSFDSLSEQSLAGEAGDYAPVVVGFCRDLKGRIAATDYYISPLEESGKIHYRRAFNLMLKLNSAPKTGGEAPWPPWSLSIQTHKVLGIK